MLCRSGWSSRTERKHGTVEQKELAQGNWLSYPFTQDELKRLSTYKTAVEAAIYTDVLTEPNSSTSTFTPAELSRLATYRAAIQAGFYTDFFV
jgi:hypothetical protein